MIGIPQVNLGQYIGAGTSIGTLQNLDTIKVDFTVTEQDFPALKIGQTVKIGVDADHLDREGTITGIDPKIDPQSRLASVEAHVDNNDHAFQPGQFVRLRVELPAEPNVVTVPQTAIITSLYGDFVYRVEEQKPPSDAKDASNGASQPVLVAHQIFVKLGRRNGPSVEVKEGLKAGDKIVTAGQNKLSNGSVIKIDNSIDPSKIGIDPKTLEGAS